MSFSCNATIYLFALGSVGVLVGINSSDSSENVSGILFNGVLTLLAATSFFYYDRVLMATDNPAPAFNPA